MRVLKLVLIIVSLAYWPASGARAATTTINLTQTYQTIEGLGGATAFDNGWITLQPFAMEICTNAFAGLNLSMLRLGDWYRYQTPLAGFDIDATLIVSNANRVLGHPVPVFMSSWAPPAFLKSNGQTGNGGTLVITNGSYAYTNFAQYWYDSINAYQSNGVTLTWMSIQNEPDFAADYDSCVLEPTQETLNGTNYASYALALNATYARLTNSPFLPKILAPECVHIAFNDLKNYAQFMNANTFYGVTTHLYGDAPGGDTPAIADQNIPNLQIATNIFPTKPHFMTEFGYSNLLSTACLIHDCFTVEQDVGFNYWSLVWPNGGDGLIITEDNYSNQKTWTNAPPGTPTQSHGWWYSPAYWAMKHYSYFIQPGYKRVGASDTDNNIRSSAFLSPDGLRLVVVLINTNNTASSTMNFNFGTFAVGASSVFQTAGTNTYAGTNTFLPLGQVTNPEILPPQSITTIVLDQIIPVGPATNETPITGTTGELVNPTLSWTPGANALEHIVYLGLNSNAVAQANTGSQEFQGVYTVTNYSPSLVAGLTYYWRVDEAAGINTNTGTVWSFSTVAPSANFSLDANDALNATSFNTVGNWVTNGTANPAAGPPAPTGTYNTSTFTLRTPSSGSATWVGGPLTLSAGAPAATGSLLLKGPNGATASIADLILDGGVIARGVNSGASGIEWVAGSLNVVSNSVVSGLGTTARFIGIASEISGSASLSNDCNVVYAGNNTAFTGPMIVGSGGAIEMSSAMNMGGSQLVLNNGTFQPTGSFTIADGNSLTLGPGGGSLDLAANVVLTMSSPMEGAGNLLVYGGGTLQIAGANSATGNLVVSNSTVQLLGNATLQNAQLGVSNNAILDASALSAPLNIGNQITLAGNFIVAVNETNFTSLLTAHNIVYGGTLTLSNAGPPLAYGETLQLFSASNYSGAFGNIVPAIPGTGLLWYTNWLAVNGTIFVTSTNPALMTPPRVTNFQLLGGNMVFSGTNGNAPGTPFYLLASTNLTLPLVDWTVVATNQFGPGGGFLCTNNLDLSQPQEFYLLQVP